MYTQVITRLPVGLAVTALVTGILSLVLGWIPFLGVVGLPLGILGVTFGAVGLTKANRGTAGGKGMAIAGLVTGVLGTGLFFVIFLALAASSTS